MTYFPDRRYGKAGDYAASYLAEIARVSATIEPTAFEKAAEILRDAVLNGQTIYACGNGGSAAISNHLLCDFSKGLHVHTNLHPKVVSLSSHVEVITAIGNDMEFAEIFALQLRIAARPGDVLLSISSSGNSENIVRAVQWAKDNGLRTIAMTGFSGGRSAGLADANLHVASDNYGVVEDLHQSIMHVLAQFLRMQHLPEGTPFKGCF